MSHQVYLRGRSRRKIRLGKDVPANPPFGGTGTPGNYSTNSNAGLANAPYVDFYQSQLVDLDDKQADRYLNQKWGRFWTVPHFEFNVKQYGTAATGSATLGMILRAPKDLVVRDVTVTTAVAPATNPIKIDIKNVPNPTFVGGTSIFAAGSAPQIGTGSDYAYVYGTASIPPAGTANVGGNTVNWPQGSFLRVEIQGVGAAPTGSNINVRIGGSLPLLDTNASWEVGDGASSSNPFFSA